MKLNRPIGILFNKKPDARTFAPDPALPVADKYVGIEIEAENIKIRNEDLDSRLNYWGVVSDGSLRNFGTEFVSAKLRGLDIRNALAELSSLFATLNIAPVYSDRTSVHIHVDSRFLTQDHLRTLVLHYLMLEPFLFQYVGQNRENNSYCIPYYNNNRGIRNLSKLFTPKFSFQDVSDVAYGGIKYEAMNVKSLTEKGSIEFRMHPGTHDATKIYNWIKVILTLFRLSKETSEADFYTWLYRKDYKGYLQEVNQYFPLSDNINLNACEYLAHQSLSKLLCYANTTRDAAQESGAHWPRASSSTTPPITNEGDF